IRDAGIVMILAAVTNFTRSLPDLLQTRAIFGILIFSIVILVQICIGLVTLYRRLWALLAGLAIQSLGIVAYVDTVLSLDINLSNLASVLFPIVPFLAYAGALYAYYHSREILVSRGRLSGKERRG